MRKSGDIITALFKNQFDPEYLKTASSNYDLFSSWQKIITEVWPRKIEDSDDPDTELRQDDIPAAAVHSQIKELERGVLLVEADHPGWIQILQTKQSELLSLVQRRYPDLSISGIAFRLSRQ